MVLDLMIHDIGIAMALVDSSIEQLILLGRVLSPTEDIAMPDQICQWMCGQFEC